MSGTATVTKLPRKIAKKIETATLTPERAMELLEFNKLNRPLRQQHVQRIASQIVEGKWKFNGDTIKVAESGDILDGQHRLWAIVEAKKPVDTILVYGIERDAFATIDTIRTTRSASDVVALNGATRHRALIGSALQWLIRWQRKCVMNYKAPEHRVENSDVEVAFANNPMMVKAIERANGLRGIGNPAIIGFFFYVLTNRNPELAERMMTTLENPAGVALSDPYFRLRAYFTNDHHKRKEPIVTIALMIKAANAAHRGAKLGALNWKNQGTRCEEFPTLEVG